jgi:hypothetical protein
MLTKKHVCLLAASLAMGLSVLMTGCDPQSASQAEKDVRASEDVQLLTRDAINQFFASKRESPSKVPYGCIYELTAKVDAVQIKEKGKTVDGQDADEHDETEFAIVSVYLPDYAAATIELHFDMEHKDELRALKKGSTITVRGKLSDQWEPYVDLRGRPLVAGNLHLNGCMIQEKSLLGQ